MEIEQLINSPQSTSGHITFTEYMEKACSRYLSYGMSYTDYWDGDSHMVKYYEEAHKDKMREQNAMNHILGKYIYDALCDVAPLYNFMAKGVRKPRKYRNKPYDLFPEDRRVSKAEAEKQRYYDGLERVKMWASTHNQKLNQLQRDIKQSQEDVAE